MGETQVPFTYNLTEMIGSRADEGRTMIVASFEVQKRHLVVFLLAFIPALLVALVFGTIIGVYATLIFVAVEAAAFYLVEHRSREGLHLRAYEVLNDRRNANTGKVFVCNREVDPARVTVFNVVGRTVPVEARAERPAPVVVPAPAPARRRRGQEADPSVANLGWAAGPDGSSPALENLRAAIAPAPTTRREAAAARRAAETHHRRGTRPGVHVAGALAAMTEETPTR